MIPCVTCRQAGSTDDVKMDRSGVPSHSMGGALLPRESQNAPSARAYGPCEIRARSLFARTE